MRGRTDRRETVGIGGRCMARAHSSRPVEPSPRRQPLVFVLAAVVVGILADSRLDWALTCEWLAATVALLGWAWLWSRGHRGWAAGFLLVAIASAAAAWHHARWRLFAVDDIGRYAVEQGQPVCVEVLAARSPVRRPVLPPDPMCTIPQGETSFLLVEARRLRDGHVWREVSGSTLLVVAGVLEHVQAGDVLRIWGTLKAPVGSQNPGERDFAALERRERRLCRLHVKYTDCVVRVTSARSSSWMAWISWLRQRGDVQLWKHVGPERAGLAAAVLLGLREELDLRTSDEFFRTGTAHLLAISGQHVVILVYGLGFVARFGWLPRRSVLFGTIAFVVFYAALTDARPPVVRAAVLVVTMCVARWLGRRAESFNTLSLAALVVLVFNPTSLFDTGAQLSFVAVSVLIWSSQWLRGGEQRADPLERLIASTRPRPVRWAKRVGRAVGELFVFSTLVWAATLPLAAQRFHLVSCVGPLINPLVWLPMALALFSGLGVFVIGGVCAPLAALCGWLCDASLRLLQGCLSAALCLPGAYWWIPHVPDWWVAGGYLAWGLMIVRFRREHALAWVLIHGGWLVLGAALAFRLLPFHWEPADKLVCTFVAVGHGTSVLIELPDGKRMLYDAGHQGTPYSAGRSISAVLWSRGIWRLDAIILSHADIDHYNAVPMLFERFRVDRLVVTPGHFEGGGTALAALRTTVEDAGIPVHTAVAGSCLWQGDEGELVAVHPPPQGVPGSDNANSLVLSLSFGGRTLLLPGDLEGAGLEQLFRTVRLDCDLAMAPHHGSQLSRPADFAAWAQPEWIVISGGAWRDTSAAEAAFSRGGSHVAHTASSGAVRVTLRAGTMQVERWREQAWSR